MAQSEIFSFFKGGDKVKHKKVEAKKRKIEESSLEAAAVHIATHLRGDQDSFAYWAEQGLEIGRMGLARLTVENNRAGKPSITLGGHAATVMRGELYM